MRLEINKSYIIYTNSESVTNKKVRVLSYMNYDRASKYSSMAENIAINEKFISANNDQNTIDYLKSQIFYDCGVIELVDGVWELTGEVIVLWDDIIDFDKTELLNEDYVYKFSFKFKDIEDADNISHDDVIKVITDALNTAYKSSDKEKIEFNLEKIKSSDLNSIESKYEQATKLLDQTSQALNAFISFADEAKSINSEFSDNNIVDKVNDVGNTLKTIQNQLSTIISQTK